MAGENREGYLGVIDRMAKDGARYKSAGSYQTPPRRHISLYIFERLVCLEAWYA